MPPLLTTMRSTRELVSGEVYSAQCPGSPAEGGAETLPHFISPSPGRGPVSGESVTTVGEGKRYRFDCHVCAWSCLARRLLFWRDVLPLTKCVPFLLSLSLQFSCDVGMGAAGHEALSFFGLVWCILLLLWALWLGLIELLVKWACLLCS